ncbi:MAG TPA: hypothetical protein VHA73_11865 [Acidimicrobiales bacterium]|nr:hypothetical protein [Acidimicrobiales bacterium]
MAQPRYDTVEPDTLGDPTGAAGPRGCPVHHALQVTEPLPTAGCPVAHHGATSHGAPVAQHGTTTDGATSHGAAAATTTGPCIDDTMRKLLRIKPTTPNDDAGAHRIFEVSILISAARCLLTYVFFPIVAPAAGAATGIGPAIGLPVGIIALVFDVLGIRRFWAANHKWRKEITLLYLVVIAFVSVLLVRDIVHLLT